ncbi:MAG: AIR carboxylase family protein, partial [Thermoanaerobaculum sp.]
MAKVMILMGSASDWGVMQETARVLSHLGVPHEAHVASA